MAHEITPEKLAEILASEMLKMLEKAGYQIVKRVKEVPTVTPTKNDVVEVLVEDSLLSINTQTLLDRWHEMCQQAITNPSVLKSNELEVLTESLKSHIQLIEERKKQL